MKAPMPKKGERSAGVAQQWNGRLGKEDNGQVGVFAPRCRAEMARLVDARLSLPQGWTQDATRCERAGIPKPALALAMVTTAERRGLPLGGDGKEPALLTGLEARGYRFVADVHCHQCRRSPGSQGADHVNTPRTLGSGEAWKRLCLRGGEKGQLVAEYLQASGTLLHPAFAAGTCGCATANSHDGLSNAPEHTPWQALARVQAQGFFLEPRVREAKNACGLAGHQVRRGDAWHHHMPW
jgi:hypothetical protein